MKCILKMSLLLMLPLFMTAQGLEVGIMVGASGYSGDIVPTNKQFSTGPNHLAFGIFGRKDLNRFLAGRLGFTYGKISGDDADAKMDGLIARNLSFQTNITELAAILEINPFGNNGEGSLLQPYVYGGVAVFRFNPKADYNGQLVALQPLGTEGQGMDGFPERYSLTQVSIPMGFGVKYRLTEQISLGIDMGIRKTFTDYLDDVSGTYVNSDDLLAGNGELAAALGNRQGELLGEPVFVETGAKRGGSEYEDWYYTAGLTLSYTFQGYGGNRRYSKRNIGCPNNF